jgi:hypothetical protein
MMAADFRMSSDFSNCNLQVLGPGKAMIQSEEYSEKEGNFRRSSYAIRDIYSAKQDRFTPEANLLPV